MGDEVPDPLHSPNQGHEKAEPARSRWTPKPEQILILESIFNSGMVNPPKDETVRIRKLLEKFGSVGDANVFYWFQNRRSRSRRRQRQIQASLNGGEQPQTSGGVVHSYGYSGVSSFMPSHSLFLPPSGSSSSSCGSVGHHDGVDGMFSFSGHMSIPEREQAPHVNSILCSSEGSILCSPSESVLQYQSGFMTVFINGMPTEVPRGPLDMKAMFGSQDLVLVHSSGAPVPFNDFGFLLQSLQQGESYFLVARPS